MGWLVGLALIATPISIVWLVKRNRAKQTPLTQGVWLAGS